MLLPIAVDVPMERRPWANWALIALMVVAFVYSVTHPDETEPFILGISEFDPSVKQHPLAIIGHLFLHADIGHLVGNMIFMWIFGNAVCAKLGHIGYVALFLAVGVLTGIIEPYGLGASGAICGVVGAYLILYPVNDVTIFYWILWRPGTFSISGYWVILVYLIFDVWGLTQDDEAIAYLSHVSGYAIGAAAAVTLLLTNVIAPNDDERTLVDIIKDRRRPAQSPRPLGAVVVQQRLHVRLPSGAVKHLPITEFLRHEAQGKPVNQFQVSEDGQAWTTFAAWRADHDV